MDRRSFLTATAGAVVATGLGGPGAAHAAAALDPAALLEQRLATALLHPTAETAPASLSALRRQFAMASAEFASCQYLSLADRLPVLVTAVEHTTREHGTAATAALAAQVYQLTARVLGKLDVSAGLQPIAADRAARAAENSGDDLLLAAAREVVASAARRTHHPEQAQRISLAAVESLLHSGVRTAATWRAAGMLYCGAGYAAAVRGDQARSAEFYREAAATAERIDDEPGRTRLLAHVRSHQISAAHKLGDAVAALETARTVPFAALPTTERQARYLVDVAQAWAMFGNPDRAHTALLAAERLAPGEVRTRGAVRRLMGELLASPRAAAMPGIRALAARVHATQGRSAAVDANAAGGRVTTT
ncbi:XRE family transcriptional regulator [Goodfellowiella coeruleoviolacea]|uniref:Transcriptional regulator n=1 Tax=Goodfellowiella coeruleoviolacea TaxID=334858 RepID=A0AAE3GK28_9PSEU|nr:XRE family transcriptional regulator [Goodfellowiella coeruleoviolacea]MCP2169712.1 hypothetical protein [Goodfellowiella coeruleoviolacea]